VFVFFQLPWRNGAHSYDIAMCSFLVGYFYRFKCPFGSVARFVASSPDVGRGVSLSFVVFLGRGQADEELFLLEVGRSGDERSF